MPTLNDNLRVARQVVAETKAMATSSNDIIKKECIPVYIPSKFVSYVKEFGRDKAERYIRHIFHTQMVRNNASIFSHKQKFISPQVTASIACVMHGVGESQELALMTVLKLMEHSQKCFYTVVFGKKNEERANGNRFNHGLVFIGNLDTAYLSSLSALKHQPEDVVVVDAYLGYVGSAKNYVKDNQKYIDTFGFSQIHYQHHIFDQAIFCQASQINAQAKEVSKQLLQEGIDLYHRHPDDQQTQVASKTLIPANVYPSFLFHSGNSGQHTSAYQNAVKSGDKKDVINASMSLLSTASASFCSDFFSKPLPSYLEESLPKFSPMSL